VALKPALDRARLHVGWQVVESDRQEGLGFDPAAGSSRGEATCPICGATVVAEYVKAEGVAGRMSTEPLAAVVLKPSGRGRDYVGAGKYLQPGEEACLQRLNTLDVGPPEEKMVAGDGRWFQPWFYGMARFRDLFTPRQLLALCTLASSIRGLHATMIDSHVERGRADAIATYLGLAQSRLADHLSSLCRWDTKSETTMSAYARQALPMVWDFVENNPFGGAAGDIAEYVDSDAVIVEHLAPVPAGTVTRASATSLPLQDDSQDAIVTDPPYYDNISYADLSDFFYVWLKRSIGGLHLDDLGSC
jgi:putative DNA methylase